METLYSIDVVELAEHPEHLETVLGWYLKEWPAAGDRQLVGQRLYGAGLPGELPMALVASSQSTVVGFISVVLYEQGIDTGRPHWVDALFTHPAFRRRGVASQLLRNAEERAKGLGIEGLYALTDVVSLYQRNGWSPAPGTNPVSSHDVVMHKQL